MTGHSEDRLTQRGSDDDKVKLTSRRRWQREFPEILIAIIESILSVIFYFKETKRARFSIGRFAGFQLLLDSISDSTICWYQATRLAIKLRPSDIEETKGLDPAATWSATWYLSAHKRTYHEYDSVFLLTLSFSLSLSLSLSFPPLSLYVCLCRSNKCKRLLDLKNAPIKLIRNDLNLTSNLDKTILVIYAIFDFIDGFLRVYFVNFLICINYFFKYF